MKTKESFKQQLRVIISVVVSFVLVLLLAQSYRHQYQTDQRLAEIQEELRDGSAGHTLSEQKSLPSLIVDRGTIGSETVLTGGAISTKS